MNTTIDTVALPVSYWIGTGIAGLAGLGALACLIMVLIPLFKEKGPGLGILGVLCGIFTYVWGWINIKKHNLKKIMIIWTACIVVWMIGYGVMMAGLVKSGMANPELYQPTPVETPAPPVAP